MVEENGTYLITEGLEGLGFQLADYMAKTAQARLILTHSGRLPGREKWKEYLSQDESEEKLEEYIKEACFNKRLQMEVALEHHYITSRENNGGKETGLKKTPLGLEKGLSDLCASYIYRYLFGDEKAAKGKNYGIEELKSTLGIASRFEKFYSYMLLMLAEDGIIKVKEDSIELLKEYGEMVEPQILKDELLAKYPESSAGLQALEHCARNYRQALSGEINPLSVLYPDGSSGMLMAVTENQDRYSNIKLHQKVITDMILKLEKTSGRRKLRILEIGAGDGKLTWNIVSELRDKNIEYYFTDIGKSFVINGRKKARMDGYGFMDFRVLDISKEPEAQGFNRYSFDVILALDVVHATSNISETMQSLKKLLVPNGVMMLVEATKPQRWVNMIWGLAEGWWYFSDADIRENSPLLSPEKWETVLSGLEFKEVRVYPEEPSKRLEADHSMIVVQQQAEITAPDFRDMVWRPGEKKGRTLGKG
jgi:2-polyprenyl-3-methyl-5-hydroxy-6-metoxy-1,4-benzoquinol methylase